MEEFPHGIMAAWSWPLWPALALLIAGTLYARGWAKLQKTRKKCRRGARCVLGWGWFRYGLRWRRRLMRWMIFCSRRTCCSTSS